MSPEDLARVQRAAHRLLTDPDLEPLVLWWQATSLNAVMPPGPVDYGRLAMSQGDRERLLSIYALSAAHTKQKKGV